VKNNSFKALAAAALVVFVAGCQNKEAPKDVAVTDVKTQPTGGTGSTAGTQTATGTPTANPNLNSNANAALTGDALLRAPGGILSKRVIYFEYDQDTVKDEYREIVQAHAKFMQENRSRKIRLEGHADERGSREYNMALGQRRAGAVKRVMGVLGAGEAAMETISFGEDKPKAQGQNDAAWAMNRRVEIVYDGE
jgi:peptidoglycan-associated lipoprotein